MEAVEMVKCFLQKKEEEGRSVRFVPLEIFSLWRVLMVKVHGFILHDPQVSQWVPEKSEYEVHSMQMAAETDQVIEISFKYMEGGRQKRPIVRYFPAEEYQEIIVYFRSHFPDESKMEGVVQRKGRYLKTQAVAYAGD